MPTRKNPVASAPKPKRPARRTEENRIVFDGGIPVFTGPLPEHVRTATPEQLKDLAYEPPD